MAELSLRQYVQQIDDIIEDSDQLEEAIAHCRHILNSFPKHIDTYRLLGKAYLESKRYGDAADIFQRVLSAIPDDFVSHVGMAIIREDEGNLDAAIWHMERSSESKPGNAAIEQELKRLIGKRDGLEPQRVRPTRGALARMYSHGELYSYATTELRKALAEDPDRPDLQVLLANTHWRTDQRLDAARLCSQILEKLPHCRDANRITAALLIESGKTEEAKSNLRRLISLDPYFAYLKNPMDDPLSVETSSILIERLTWTGGSGSLTGDAEQPDWVASISANLKGDESPAEVDEDMPQWLRAESQPSPEAPDADPGSPPTIHPFEGASPPTGEELPQWMREAGWGSDASSEGEDSSDQGSTPVSEDTGEESGDLASAEFPDWLSEITSTEQELSARDSVDPGELPSLPEDKPIEDTTGFEGEESALDDIGFDSNFPAKIDGESEIPENDDGTESKMSMPDNFTHESAEEEERDENISDSPDRNSITSEEMSNGGTQELPPWLEPATPGATDTIVTWLGDKSGDGSPAPPDDIPTWMRGTGPLIDSTPRDLPQPASQPIKSDSPPLKGSMDIQEQEAPKPKEKLAGEIAQEPAADVNAEPHWLEDISEPQESAAVLQDVEPVPDWIDDLPSEDDQILASSEDFEEPPESPRPAEFAEPDSQAGKTGEEEPPDWLHAVIGKDAEAVSPTPDEQPDWLEAVAENGSDQEIVEGEPVQESPVWLTESAEEGTAEPAAEAVQPDWLKTLSESSQEEIQETIPDEETAPEWLTGSEAPDPEFEQHEEIEAVPMESSLDEMPMSEALEAIVEAPIEESTIRRSGDVSQEEIIHRTIDGPKTEEIAPDWLQDLSASELVEEQESTQPEEEGDWLQQIEADELAEPTFETPDLQSIEPGMADEQSPEQDGEIPPGTEPVVLDAPDEELSLQNDAEKEIENRLEWLQESAQEVTPEPELSQDESSIEDIAETLVDDKPMDEEEVYGFLEGLASKHEVEIEEIPIFDEKTGSQDSEVESEGEVGPGDAQTEAQDELPEDYEAGLEWLEQLATEDEYEEVIAPDFQSETEELEESEVPDWLEEVAEKSEVDDYEAAQPESTLPDEDPSILDTIIARKSDLAAAFKVQLEGARHPQAGKPDSFEVELGASLSEKEDVESEIEEIAESLLDEPSTELEEQPLDEVQVEHFKPVEHEIDETSAEGQLSIARSSLENGDSERALEFYTRLIDQKKEIEAVISDLKTAVNNTPMSPTLWQTLGDAYMQDGQITEAIDAYRKGMEAV